MSKIKITDLTSKGLKALAKDVKLPKYSRKSTDTVRKELSKMDLSKMDLSKYDVYDVEEAPVKAKAEAKVEAKAPAKAKAKAKDNEAKNVPHARRRSIRKGGFGRR